MNNNAYSFFIGWFIIIGMFWGSTRFEGTRTLTYYVLWLSIVLLLVTHSNEFGSLIRGAIPQQETGSGNAQSPITPINTPPVTTPTQFAAL